MSRWISKVAIALGITGLLALPGVSYAGEMIKEHDCVGRDTVFPLTNEPVRRGDYAQFDAGCTPLGSMIMSSPAMS